MRILIISTFFPPLNSIASLRPYSWAKYWTEDQHDVTVLTTTKTQNPDVQIKLSNNGFQLIEVAPPRFLNQLKKSYVSAPQTTKSKKLLPRILEHLKNKKGIFNSCRMPDFSHLWIAPALKALQNKEKWDLVISTAGPYTVHMVAEKLKKQGLAKKWIADYRDTWSNNFAFPGLFPFNLIERIWEKKLLRSADIITTVSQPLADSFKEIFHHPHVHVIANGFDPTDLDAIDAARLYPEDGIYRIVHTGSLYQSKRDPSPLFQAISEISQDPVYKNLLDRLEVIFAGTNQANVPELIDRYGVSRWVKMVGFLSREQALKMQRDAHALLFLPWSDHTVDGILTGKLFEYVFSKTPIIAVGAKKIEASQQFILDANCGQAFTDTSKLKTFLIKELCAPVKRITKPDGTFLSRYERKTLALKLLETLNET